MAKRKKVSTAGRKGIEGFLDVIGGALALLAIIILLFMLFSLVMWLRQDINVTFSDLGTNITDAVIVRGNRMK